MNINKKRIGLFLLLLIIVLHTSVFAEKREVSDEIFLEIDLREQIEGGHVFSTGKYDVFLDDENLNHRKIFNVVHLPKGKYGDTHQLRIEVDGYEPYEETISYNIFYNGIYEDCKMLYLKPDMKMLDTHTPINEDDDIYATFSYENFQFIWDESKNLMTVKGHGQIPILKWYAMLHSKNYDFASRQIKNFEFISDNGEKIEFTNEIKFPSLQGQINFNGVVDVSKVTDMRGMFAYNKYFNSSIEDWDTSNVTNMRGMFAGCEEFNQPINNWDTSNVTNMKSMFSMCEDFNQPLDNWDTSNVTNMSNMFAGTKAFNQNISSWNTSSLDNAREMFYKADSIKNISFINRNDDLPIVASSSFIKSTKPNVVKFKQFNAFDWEATDNYLIQNITDNTQEEIKKGTSYRFESYKEYHIYNLSTVAPADIPTLSNIKSDDIDKSEDSTKSTSSETPVADSGNIDNRLMIHGSPTEVFENANYKVFFDGTDISDKKGTPPVGHTVQLPFGNIGDTHNIRLEVEGYKPYEQSITYIKPHNNSGDKEWGYIFITPTMEKLETSLESTPAKIRKVQPTIMLHTFDMDVLHQSVLDNRQYKIYANGTELNAIPNEMGHFTELPISNVGDRYNIEVKIDGYETYKTAVTVKPYKSVYKEGFSADLIPLTVTTKKLNSGTVESTGNRKVKLHIEADYKLQDSDKKRYDDIEKTMFDKGYEFIVDKGKFDDLNDNDPMSGMITGVNVGDKINVTLKLKGFKKYKQTITVPKDSGKIVFVSIDTTRLDTETSSETTSSGKVKNIIMIHTATDKITPAMCDNREYRIYVNDEDYTDSMEGYMGHITNLPDSNIGDKYDVRVEFDGYKPYYETVTIVPEQDGGYPGLIFVNVDTEEDNNTSDDSVHAVHPITPHPMPKAIEKSIKTASDWAKDGIKKAEIAGLHTKSMMEENFKEPATREDFAELVFEMYSKLGGKVKDTNNPFTDTNNQAIINAYNAGFISGTGNGTFSPNAELTREQLAVIVVSALKATGNDYELVSKFQKKYADESEISSWAKDAVGILNNYKILNGDDKNLMPKDKVTKEMAVLMMFQAYNQFK